MQTPNGEAWALFFRIGTGYVIRFPKLADFLIDSSGMRVRCRPVPGTSEGTLQHLYLNQILPLAMSKQGKMVFHASAVEIDGVAVAFMGESGKGKSTLAAGFATSGYRFLTDDGLMAELGDGGFQIMPSHPSIRLWQDSEAALIAPDAPTAPALEFTTKSRFLAGESIPFCDTPRPLRRVYFLGDGSAQEITFQCMNAAEALVEWVKHSFLLDIEEKPMLATHFDQVAKLANQPIHYRLDYPRRYEDMARLRQAIIEHATSENTSA